jgi:hypothetical protein
MQRCSSSHSTHRRRSFHARQSKAAQLRQPVRATATSAAAGSDVELAATVGHLISWLASSGASVTNRLEPKRFKADVGERVGLIAAVDAAAGEKEVLVGGSPTWTQCTEHMAATSMPATPVEAGCEGSRQAVQVLVMTVSTVYAKFSCFRNSAQPGKSMCLKVCQGHTGVAGPPTARMSTGGQHQFARCKRSRGTQHGQQLCVSQPGVPQHLQVSYPTSQQLATARICALLCPLHR